MKPVACRKIIAIEKDTEVRHDLLLEVWEPQPVDDGQNYFCLARIVGLEGEFKEVGGVDSLQSLSLALRWLRVRVEALRADKYEFMWEDGGHVMESIDYFPQL